MPGFGTTFTLYIPASTQQHEKEKRAESLEEGILSVGSESQFRTFDVAVLMISSTQPRQIYFDIFYYIVRNFYTIKLSTKILWRY